MKKNTIMLIMIITISMVLLTWNKSYSYKMDDNEPEEIERKEFGIFLEKSQGSQKNDTDYESTDTFPNTGYLLNTSKTKCYEYGSDTEIPQAVEQSLTNGVIDGSIIVQSTKSMYCKIYFDKDEKPTVSSFNITGKTSNNEDLNNGFTYQTSDLPITFDYTDKENNVAQYCVSEINNSDSCSWKQLNGKSDIYTLTNTADGLKTIYVYLKDMANNISTAKPTNITVDRTKPVISTLTLTGTKATGTLVAGYTHTNSIKYSGSITETNMEGYCVGENTCNSYTNQSKTISGSLTIGNTEGSHTVVISVKDKAGNITTQNNNITLDLKDPTILLSQKNITENTIVVTVTVADTGSSGIKNVTCTAVGNNETKTGTYNSTAKTCTFSGLKDGTIYSITGVATDNSGRSKTSSAINVTTVKGKLTRENIPSKLFNGVNPNGLSNNLLGDMYRFVGTKATVDNWICFGYNNVNTDCKSETNDYMYRIIGITEDGQMKLIKNTSIMESTTFMYEWDDSEEVDISWPNSSLYKRLNGLSSGTKQGYRGNANLFIDSKTSNVQYIQSTGSEENKKWYNKIENHTWKYGTITDRNFDADGGYNIESNFADNIEAKIGLMYLSDYYYSYATDGSNSSNTNCYFNNSCMDSWINLCNNGKISEGSSEWTIQRYGSDFAGNQYTWIRCECSYWNVRELNSGNEVRPVFYLNSDVRISGGRGASSDPFIVAA